MYKSFLLSELKKWFRDPMMRFMMFYPIFFGILGRFVLPRFADSSGFNIHHFADVIIVLLTLMTPHVFGALIAFSILEDRDDHILTSVRVTPLSIHQYLSFRLMMVLIFSFFSCTYVMWFSDIGNLPLKHIFAIAFLASLAAPATGLFINVLSQNKIEGFAVMKGTGTIILVPILALFFLDKKELFFSFAPGFWAAKAISSIILGEGILFLTYNQYYFMGLIYIILLNIIVYKIFLNRTGV